jgi:plastocyanin
MPVKKMGKYFSMIIFLLVLIVGFSVLSLDPAFNTDSTGNTILESVEDNEEEIKVFVLTGKNFKFMAGSIDNPDMKVNQGDKIRIEFSSVGGTHDWTLDEFSAKTNIVKDGEGQTSVEFIADKKGTFEYYCSIGPHRSLGMKGNFIVE